MRFINASMMPWLNEFVDNPTPGHFSWMNEFWSGPDSSHDYSEIDTEQHRQVFNELPQGVNHFLLGHEYGTRQGRDAYNIAEQPTMATSLFSQVTAIGRTQRDAQYGFYGVMTFEECHAAHMDALDAIADAVDFFAPKAYLREKSIPEFRAKVCARVQWLKQRWPDKPVYLCAWHKMGYGVWDGQYMNPSTMYAYIEAIRASGADGAIWWAGSSEGVTAPDGIGTTNAALQTKSYNHPHRWNHWRADWAEVLRQFKWDPV